MKPYFIIIVNLILISFSSLFAYEAEEDSTAELTNGPWATIVNPQLPNVLILGDSISIGYTLKVRENLLTHANVFRPTQNNGAKAKNCQGTTLGIQKIDGWIAIQPKWDVIHFNWGLHDLKHVNGKTGKNSNSFDDPQQADPETYKRNLMTLVAKLKATGAKLIFATTTPYPAGVKPARDPKSAKIYNDIAREIMAANNIQINDLYSLCEGQLETIQNPVNVHFNKAGNQVLSDQVTQVLKELLIK